MIEAFRSSDEFHKIKMESDSVLYLQRIEDFKGKVWSHFFDLDLWPLESNNEEEEVGEVGDEGLQGPLQPSSQRLGDQRGGIGSASHSHHSLRP